MLTKLTKNKKAKKVIHERTANLLCDGPCAETCAVEGFRTNYSNKTYLDYYYSY
jgi:hypothetical protein